MTDNELKVLLEAAQSLKLNPAELKAVNPFTMQGKVAQSLQMAVQALNPLQAAKWSEQAGQGVSLEAAAVLAGIAPMTKAAHQNLMQISPEYVEQHEAARAKFEADQLAMMTRKADEMAKASGRDPNAAPVFQTWQERSAAEHRQHQQLEAEARRRYSPAGGV